MKQDDSTGMKAHAHGELFSLLMESVCPWRGALSMQSVLLKGYFGFRVHALKYMTGLGWSQVDRIRASIATVNLEQEQRMAAVT